LAGCFCRCHWLMKWLVLPI